jgi:hypothetical protein
MVVKLSFDCVGVQTERKRKEKSEAMLGEENDKTWLRGEVRVREI